MVIFEAMTTKSKYGFGEAGDKIWEESFGNNVFATHRDACPVCSAAYQARVAGDKSAKNCSEGDAIYEGFMNDLLERIDAARERERADAGN